MSKSKRKIKSHLSKYRRSSGDIPAEMGNYANQLYVPNRANYVFVKLQDGTVIDVYNVRVTPKLGLEIWIGYLEKEPHLLQVTSARNGQARFGDTGNPYTSVQPHHLTHEWMAIQGGNDVVFSQLRQFMPLRPTPLGGLTLGIYRGVGRLNDTWVYFSGSSINLAPYAPATGSLFALVYETNVGTPAAVAGTLRDFNTLSLSDIPTPPAGSLPVAAIRLYGGQTGIVESRTTTDLIDLRFPYIQTPATSSGGGGGGASATGTSGFDNPMIAIGDMIYEDTGNIAASNLAIQELGAKATGTSEATNVGQAGRAYDVLRSHVAYDQYANLFWQPDQNVVDPFANSWVVVDLGASYTIRSWYLRQDTYYLNQFDEYEVATSNTPTGTWTTAATVALNGSEHTQTFASAQTSRYFRFKPTSYVGVPGAGQGLPKIFNIALYQQASGLAPTRLPIGPEGYKLKSISGKPSWQPDILGAMTVYDDSTFKVTGTSISFGSGLSVSVTGSFAYVNSVSSEVALPYFRISGSNPPTNLDLNSYLGLPGVMGNGYSAIFDNSITGTSSYLATSNGYEWSYMSLTKAIASLAILGILAADAFTGSNGTHLNAHTMDVGSGWTENSGSWTISSNTAVQAMASGASYVATEDAGTADVKIRVRVKTQAASGSHVCGIALRFVDTNNYWQIFFDTANAKVQINELQSGTPTMRAQASWTNRFQKYVDIEVTASGNNISVIFDGGFGLSYTSTFNNTATKHGIFEYRDGSYKACTFEDFQVISIPSYPWTRRGTVISAGAGDNSNVYEPVAIQDDNARILTGRVVKMWYTGGWGTTNINYAESLDGINFTKYAGNPVIAGCRRPQVLIDSGIYYMYCTDDELSIDLYRSTDGVSDWVLDTASVLSIGAGGAWDDTLIANCFVWKEGPNDWRMLYDGTRNDYIWKLGYATSSNGRTWTKHASNPVVSLDGMVGSPFVKKVGSYYYLFAQKGPQGDFLPTWIIRLRSTDLVNWTQYPQFSIAPRIGSGEGENNYVGQTADTHILEFNGQAYMYFSAASDGSQSSGAQHIVLATASLKAIGDW